MTNSKFPSASNLESSGLSEMARFRLLSTSLAALAKTANITVQPFFNSNLPHFSCLDSEKQASVVRKLEIYVSILEKAVVEKSNLKDNKKLTWTAFKLLGLTPCSDLMNFIKDTNVIELYDHEGFQVFRSLNFFELCSYTVEDIYCRQWTDLFRRPNSAVMEKLMEIAATLTAGNLRHTIRVDLPRHEVMEIDSPFLFELSADVDFLSPLFDSHHKFAGNVAIETAHITGGILDPIEQEKKLNELMNQ